MRDSAQPRLKLIARMPPIGINKTSRRVDLKSSINQGWDHGGIGTRLPHPHGDDEARQRRERRDGEDRGSRIEPVG
jgi:hypothetical protein